MEEFWKKLLDGCVDVAWRLVAAMVILIIGVALIKLIVKLLKKSRWGAKADPTLHNFITSLTKAVMYIILFITLIAIMGVPMASFVTVLASAGAAIALALQGSLANFASGIIILIFRPIRNGEYVEIGDDSGTVIEVGIFYTTLRTPDNKHIIIPNSTVTSSSTVNYSREDLRRLSVDFDVAYGTDSQKVKDILSSIIDASELALKDPAPSVNMSELGDSAISFSVKVWCKNSDFWALKFELLEKCTKSLEENGIEVPFNQLDVHIVEKR